MCRRQLCDISFSLRSISYLIREICWLKINQFPCQVIKKLMKGLTIDDTDNWGDLVCHKRAVVLLITQLSLSIIKRVVDERLQSGLKSAKKVQLGEATLAHCFATYWLKSTRV